MNMPSQTTASRRGRSGLAPASSTTWLLLGALLGSLAIAWIRSRPVPVQRHRVALQELVVETYGTGTLEAQLSATLAPEVVGRLASVAPREGQAIAAGSVVAVLETGELEARRQVAVAERTAAEAARLRLQADVDHARAVEHLAQIEAERAGSLHSRRALPAADLDRRVGELALARAAVSRALGGLGEGEARVVAARRALAHRNQELGRATLRAPFAGVVVERVRDPGDIAGPGAPVLRLLDPTSLRVEAWVDEADLSRLEPGQAARLLFRSEPGVSRPGRLGAIRRSVDRETREVLAYVHPEAPPASWAVGQRVDVLVEVARRSARAVPERLVRWNGGETEVLVEVEGRVSRRRVRLGERGQGMVEVLEGLAPDDVVLEAPPGSRELRVGSRVEPR